MTDCKTDFQNTFYTMLVLQLYGGVYFVRQLYCNTLTFNSLGSLCSSPVEVNIACYLMENPRYWLFMTLFLI